MLNKMVTFITLNTFNFWDYHYLIQHSLISHCAKFRGHLIFGTKFAKFGTGMFLLNFMGFS